MAERMGAGKGKKGRKIGTNQAKCTRYYQAARREKNKARKAANRKRHLALARARRARNHPEKVID